MYKAICICAMVLIAGSCFAKEGKGVEKIKVYQDSFDVDPRITLDLDINESNVTIKTTNESKVSYTFTVKVRAESEEDANEFIQNTIPTIEKGPNEIDVYMKLCVSKVVVTNNRKKIKFNGGSWIKFIDYDMDLVISIPKNMKLDMGGANDKVTIEDLDGNLNLKLYDSSVKGGTIKGSSNIALSYGDAFFTSLKSVEKLKIYEVKFEAGEVAGNVDLKSSYSRVTIPVIENLILHSYEDHLIFTNVGSLTGQLSYTDLSAAEIQNWDAKAYESDVSVGSLQKMDLVSHYTTYNIGSIEVLDIENTYEDKYNLGALAHLKGTGHYSKFKIKSLSATAKYKGFEDEIEIDWVAPTVTSLIFTGQYLDVELNVSPKLTYSLDLKLQYPNINYPSSDFNGLFEKQGEKITTVLVHKNGNANSAKFVFETYEGKIEIEKAVAQ
jgi:hypothetical protein